MKLHNYFRSSASYRVRIALNLKALDYEYVSCHLRRGDHRSEAFRKLNPHALVPALETDGAILTQSLAIIEYLEETHPQPALLPSDPLQRARVRAIALSIACEIHPLDNLRVLAYLQNQLGLDEDARNAWYHHWIHTEFRVLEERLEREHDTGLYCHGDQPTLADICLVPQVANAQRFNVDLDHYPTIMRINHQCLKLDAFAKAMPAMQPDAEG
jgi:maleylacetoacetate isomerase